MAINRARGRFRFFMRNLAASTSPSDDEDEPSEASSTSSSFYLQQLLGWSYIRLRRLERNRYLFRGRYRSHERASHRYEADLDGGTTSADEAPWLNEDEFLGKYRMTRVAFNQLVDLIKDDPVFHSGYFRGRRQRPVEYQVLTTLKALGSEGTASSNPNLRDVFGTGRGTNTVYIRRVVHALLARRDDFVSWPDEDERKDIARRIEDLTSLPNCVGIVDGTLFPLAFRPQTADAADYKGRKHLYTLSSIIVCDDQRLIRYYVAGWPGSTHDNRIARNTKMWNDPLNYFNHNEYIMGDSAFENHWFVVSAFTSPPGSNMPREQSCFNTCLSRARVISEHTIGLLKGRFPWLRSIRNTLSNNPSTLRQILSYIDACVILHNFLVQRGLAEAGEDWEEDDDITEMDLYERLPDDDELMMPVPAGVDGDFRRRQLLYYLQERGTI